LQIVTPEPLLCGLMTEPTQRDHQPSIARYSTDNLNRCARRLTEARSIRTRPRPDARYVEAALGSLDELSSDDIFGAAA
jgi:hypothetical protein